MASLGNAVKLIAARTSTMALREALSANDPELGPKITAIESDYTRFLTTVQATAGIKDLSPSGAPADDDVKPGAGPTLADWLAVRSALRQYVTAQIQNKFLQVLENLTAASGDEEELESFNGTPEGVLAALRVYFNPDAGSQSVQQIDDLLANIQAVCSTAAGDKDFRQARPLLDDMLLRVGTIRSLDPKRVPDNETMKRFLRAYLKVIPEYDDEYKKSVLTDVTFYDLQQLVRAAQSRLEGQHGITRSSYMTQGTKPQPRNRRPAARSADSAGNNVNVCSHCGKKYHTRAKCWDLHPELKGMAKDTDEACRNFANGRCTRGDTCKFKHQGPAAAAESRKMALFAAASSGGSTPSDYTTGGRGYSYLATTSPAPDAATTARVAPAAPVATVTTSPATASATRTRATPSSPVTTMPAPEHVQGFAKRWQLWLTSVLAALLAVAVAVRGAGAPPGNQQQDHQSSEEATASAVHETAPGAAPSRELVHSSAMKYYVAGAMFFIVLAILSVHADGATAPTATPAAYMGTTAAFTAQPIMPATTRQPARASSFSASVVGPGCGEPGDCDFVVDSGSTVHVVCEEQYLTITERNPAMSITTGGGDVRPDASGTVDLGPLGEATAQLCRNFGVNLLSEGRLDDQGMSTITQNGAKFILDRPVDLSCGALGDASILAEAKKGPNGLYMLRVEGNEQQCPDEQQRPESVHAVKSGKSYTMSNISQAELVHQRTCHHNNADLANMLGEVGRSQDLCKICVKAKMEQARQQPGSHKKEPATRCLGIVDVDFTSPKSGLAMTPEGYTTGILFRDRFSEWLMFIPVKKKTGNQVCTALQMFRTFAEHCVRDNLKLGTIYVDSDPIMKSKEVTSWCAAQNIHVEFSPPDRHDKNSFAEGITKFVGNGARASMIQGGAPVYLWVQAISQKCFVSNRVLRRGKGCTPEENFTGKDSKDALQSVRVLFCEAWRYVPGPKRQHKDAERAVRCVNLGNSWTTYGSWNLLNLETRRIIVAHDVIFCEDNFPFSEEVNQRKGHDRGREQLVGADFLWPTTRLPAAPAAPAAPAVAPAGNHAKKVRFNLSAQQEAKEREIKDGGDEDDLSDDDHEADAGAQDDLELAVGEPPAAADDEGEPLRRSHRDRAPSRKALENAQVHLCTMTPEECEQRLADLDKINVVRTENADLDFPDTPVRELERRSFLTRLQQAEEATSSTVFQDHIDNYPTVPAPTCFVTWANPEPKGWKQVMKLPQVEREAWIESMRTEYDTLVANGTWELVPKSEVPPGTTILRPAWVCKEKLLSDNSTKKKARVVAGGNREKLPNGMDTFAPTPQASSTRILLAIAARFDLDLFAGDFSAAFLNATAMYDGVYMYQPDGFAVKGKENHVCRLLKGLYGTKTANRGWSLEVAAALQEFGMTRCKADHGLYYMKVEGKTNLLLIHVDDIIWAGREQIWKKLVAFLQKKYKFTDLGPLEWILGMRVQRNRAKKTISLDQEAFIRNIGDTFLTDDMEPITAFTPSDANEPPSKEMCPQNKQEEQFMKDKPYRGLLCSLGFAVHHTRPDCAQAFGTLARHQQKPGPKHWKALVRLARYMVATAMHGLIFGDKGEDHALFELIGFCDADLGGDLDTRRSTTGFVFMLYGCIISYKSILQKCVALSTCEAEYTAAAEAAREAVWLFAMASEISIGALATPIRINEDNKGAIALASNPVGHGRNKHIDIRTHFIRELTEQGKIALHYIKSELNLADIFTKALGRQKFMKMRKMLLGW